MHREIGLAILMCLSGCAYDANPYVNSVKPTGEKTVFRYGNFCGPSLPDGLSSLGIETQRAERVQFIANIVPVDDIDAICKQHDLCYENMGHDNAFCDWSMHSSTDVLSLRFNRAAAQALSMSGISERNIAIADERTLRPCGRLADQMTSAFSIKYKRRGLSNGWTSILYLPTKAALLALESTSAVGVDSEDSYPTAGLCDDLSIEGEALFELNLFKNCFIKIGEGNKYRRDFKSQYGGCNSLPTHLKNDVDSYDFEEVEALWARNYCMQNARYNFRYEGRAPAYINTGVSANDCEKYMDTSSVHYAKLKSPWHEHIKEKCVWVNQYRVSCE